MPRKAACEYAGYFEVLPTRLDSMSAAVRKAANWPGYRVGAISWYWVGVICCITFAASCAAIGLNKFPYMDDFYLLAMQKQDGYWAPTNSFQAMWGHYRWFYTTSMAPLYWFLGDHLWIARCVGIAMHAATSCVLLLVVRYLAISRPAQYLVFVVYLFFPYSLEAIAWPANILQYPLAPFLAITGAWLLLIPSQKVHLLLPGALLLGGATWIHEQIWPIAILLLLLCTVLYPSRRRYAAGSIVLMLSVANAVLIFATRHTNIRLSGPSAGSFINVYANIGYLGQLLRTTPIGDYYYETAGVTLPFTWLALLSFCSCTIFVAALGKSQATVPPVAARLMYPAWGLAFTLGAYFASLMPILMSPFPWHTGRVVYIPFLAFAIAVGFGAEMFIRLHRWFRLTAAAISSLVVVWSACILRAESEAFNFQTNTNFNRSASLHAQLGDEIGRGRSALIVGGFPYGDTARPLFGDHFIGMTPGELKSVLGLRISGPPTFPLIISAANVAHFCKSHGHVIAAPAGSTEAHRLKEADRLIIAIWHHQRWVIQQNSTINPELVDLTSQLRPCGSEAESIPASEVK